MSVSLNGFAEEIITLKMGESAARGTPVAISGSFTAAPAKRTRRSRAFYPPRRRTAMRAFR